MLDCTTLDPSLPSSGGRAPDRILALAVCWSASGDHWGEVLRVSASTPSSGWVFGRESSTKEEPGRLKLVRERPGSLERKPLDSPYISRAQMLLRGERDRIEVQNIGKRRLIVDDGTSVSRAVIRPGQTLEIENQLLFVCVERTTGDRLKLASASHAFGTADPHGIVGESPAAWQLRESMAFLAARSAHVLLLGESGTGKELAAQGIHALSDRHRRPLVARNAAVFPPGLIDAELFGNIANYPNAGSPERPGLVGQAHGSTLFLDEIGELPLDLQAHLLRVLDENGEYQRLGEARPRTADIRLIGATARSIDRLRSDLAARFKLRLRLPGLNERREDIPLLVRHLLEQAAHEDSKLTARSPRLTPRLMRFLVTHRYTTHVRELDALLWRELAKDGDRLDLSDAVGDAARTQTPDNEKRIALSRGAPTAQEIAECLERNGGVQEHAWRELGLSSRYALKRLMRKYGIRCGDGSGVVGSQRCP